MPGAADRICREPARDEHFMGKLDKTLGRILRGEADANIRFDELRKILKRLGFVERTRGDHHIFTRDGVAEILNLQPRNALGKAYQVKQAREVIVRYGLALRLRDE
jgi:predicted RNA binding protein YcfA (HicA-like mRNA interferase family)